MVFFEIGQPYYFSSPRKLSSIERLNRFNVFYRQKKQIYSPTSLSLFESIGVPYPTILRREDLVNLLLAQISIIFLRSAYSSTRNQTVEGLWIEEFTNKIDLYSAFSFIIDPTLSIHLSSNDDSTNFTVISLSKTAINSILHAMLAKRMESISLYKESPISTDTFDKYKLTIFPSSYVNSIVAYILKSFEGKYVQYMI